MLNSSLSKNSFIRIFVDVFTSTKVVLGLFALLICFLIPVTIFTEHISVLLVPVKIILVVIGLDLMVCTLFKWKTLKFSTKIIHLGSIIILAGSVISAFGFVATINIYEESSIDTVFRWDVKKDVPLGFDLHVTRINTDFYPVDVKVGVLKNGQKADLIVVRTGDFFDFENYRVQVVSLDPQAEDLQLAVQTLGGEPLGVMSTSGRRDLPSGFSLDFKLVAFKTPDVKRVWVDLELREKGSLVASGTSEVNHPLRWKGMQFFLTQVAADESGRGVAGIQISRDPGIKYVYGGFVILCLGLLLAFKRWVTVACKPGVGM